MQITPDLYINEYASAHLSRLSHLLHLSHLSPRVPGAFRGLFRLPHFFGQRLDRVALRFQVRVDGAEALDVAGTGS